MEGRRMSDTKLGGMRMYIIRPALTRSGMWSQSAENIVLGTGLVESRYDYLDQTTPGPGPAYGYWQMEKLTHDDLWATYLPSQPSALRDTLREMAGERIAAPHVTVLHWNLLYAAAMCRLRYKRVPAALPAADDYEGMAAYWKQWYNTPLGKGKTAEAIPFFKQAVNS
jgi:hypothetical protein